MKKKLNWVSYTEAMHTHGETFSFTMEERDISSFSTDLHIAATLGQHADTWALDWVCRNARI